MKKIIQQFIDYPFYGKMVIFLLLLLGVFSYNSMLKSSFPERESKIISISVAYPGATPKQMEEGVTTLIENALRGLPGIKETTSSSAENRTSVIITVFDDVKTDEVLRDVKNAVDGISNLPSGADRPIVSWNKSKTPAYFFSLSGDVDMMKLKQVAYQIEDDLLASGKISQISISGIPSVELAIELKEESLLRYNTSINQIQKAISENNLDISGGVIRNAREEINVLSRERSLDPREIENIVVKQSQNGAVVRIKDLATVKYQFQESPTASYLDGDLSVFFGIQKLLTEDLIEISNHVDQYIEEFNKNNSKLRITPMFDFSSILNARLDILSTNGIIGIVLVIVFLSLFLNTRLALWVAWGIPASFLGMFVIAYLLGVTINMISLFGMIMVIGILVDDGVVIGENIYHHFEKGKSPRQASIDGATEVLPAIFTSVSTTIVAFFPLLLLQGHMSMMNEMAVVVIACLAMSLFEGTFVLPGHLSHKAVLDTKKEIGFFKRFRNLIDRGLFWFRDRVYLKVLKLVLKYKWISLSFLVSCILVTAGLLAGGKIGITFFPAMEDDSFTIDLALKPGTSTEVTKSYLYYLEKTCRDVSKQMTNEYEEDEEIIKYLELRTGSSFSGAESGTHAGQITVMLKDIENVTWSVSEVKRRIAKKVGSIKEAVKFAVGASNRWGAPVSISLLSRNEEQLTEATDWLKLKLGEISELYNINDNNRLGSQEIRIKLKEKAYVLGFTQQSLMNQVRQAFFGGQAQRLVDGKDEVRVYVRYSKEDRVNIGQLEKLKIQTAQGTFPLYSLVDFTIDRSPVVISRYNGRREITVDAFQKDPSKPVNPIIQDVNNTILSQIKTKFPEVDFVYRGQMQSSQEEGAHLLHGFLIAFIIMVLIIMASFKSFYQGILILLVIPAGWISAIWGHGIEGYPLSMLSAFGIVALSGTIINDAVVYLSKFNQCLKEGMGLIDSLLESARSRFRPILLTSLTTVVGLYPLILDASIQARFLIPMAISLAYGIFIGTIFIIFLFPVIVLCGNSVKYRFRKLFYKGNIERLDVEPVIVHKKHKLESID